MINCAFFLNNGSVKQWFPSRSPICYYLSHGFEKFVGKKSFHEKPQFPCLNAPESVFARALCKNPTSLPHFCNGVFHFLGGFLQRDAHKKKQKSDHNPGTY